MFFVFRIYYICLTNCKYDVGRCKPLLIFIYINSSCSKTISSHILIKFILKVRSICLTVNFFVIRSKIVNCFYHTLGFCIISTWSFANEVITFCCWSLVRRVSRKFGFKEVSDDEDWTLYWTDYSVALERVMEMKKYQVRLLLIYMYIYCKIAFYIIVSKGL